MLLFSRTNSRRLAAQGAGPSAGRPGRSRHTWNARRPQRRWNLEKYRDLYGRVEELNAIAIEELQHFQLVLKLLKARGIPFGQPYPSRGSRG